MTFDNWMRENGLSESSIKKYRSAITGPLSLWAREAGLVTNSLENITEPTLFANVAKQINHIPIFQKRNIVGKQMYSGALNQFHAYLVNSNFSLLSSDIKELLEDQKATATDKMQLICARVGQGLFRTSLIEFWGNCSVTGYADLSVLVASHIKPWSKSSNQERLDRYNGLLLVPNLDKVFDAGLITFNDAGTIVISEKLVSPESLGIFERMHVSLEQKHLKYMRFHREQVYRS